MPGDDIHNKIHKSTMTGPVVQVGTLAGDLVFQQVVPAAVVASDDVDDWVRRTTESTVWRHVPADRDISGIRSQLGSLVAVLAGLRDDAKQALAADPWLDTGVALRFIERIEWLIGEPGHSEPLDLYPAEAALLILTPFLYRAQWLTMAANRVAVNPASLRAVVNADVDRAAFERFVEKNSMLATRAELRPSTESAIGWWLFHRWLIQREDFGTEDRIRELLDQAEEAVHELGEIVAPGRLSTLLHGLHRGPGVCNREYLDTLKDDDRVRGPGHQRIREQRLALLLTLAYGVCVEMHALPDIVAEHLGIPNPVDPELLNETLEHLTWGGPHEFPVLQANCHHEAVIEGLREYTARGDELLHAINRTVRERIRQPMPALPARLSANEVAPADGVFTGWASFRLDEHRVRDLLMGVALYKDPDLAVREFYQNSLDGCRHRRARTEYLNRTGPASHSYEGRITITQGVNDSGRKYVEGRDNGIGMGDAELRGVFCNAGARFPEQPDFKLEHAAWARLTPPVQMYPNSRFGIGVLSYFMLADEIEVTTCRMGMDGTPGPLLRASIFGPGHLFRITTLAERGDEPGTSVRLYLRSDLGASWSVVDILERILGIAEFATTARHGKRHATWPAGTLKPRGRPKTGTSNEAHGLYADGALIPWRKAPRGLDVVWCEQGGGLLVDGLVVQPMIRKGVLSTDHAGLRGVVVNLSGEFAPNRLSVDRRHVLDDLSRDLGRLLEQAARTLGRSTPLPTFEWICSVAQESPALGDLLTKRAMRVGEKLHGRSQGDTQHSGCFPADVAIMGLKLDWKRVSRHEYGPVPKNTRLDNVPNNILLWRLLAHRPNVDLSKLAEIYPNIESRGDVLSAIPSDQLIFASTEVGDDAQIDQWPLVEEIATGAAQLGLTWRQTAQRAAGFGIQIPQLDHLADSWVQDNSFDAVVDMRGKFIVSGQVATAAGIVAAASRTGTPVNDIVTLWREQGVAISQVVENIALAADDDLFVVDYDEHTDHVIMLEPGAAVPPGHIARASHVLDMLVPEVCAELARYGLTADPRGLPDQPGAETVTLLSKDLDGSRPWLSQADPVSPYHILAAARANDVPPSQIIEELTRLGFTTPAKFPADARDDELPLLKRTYEDAPLPPCGVTYSHIFDAATDQNCSVTQVISRLEDFGFEIPFRPPTRLTALDKELLSSDGPLRWWGLTVGSAMPFSNVLIAARDLNLSPTQIARKLASYGIQTSCQRLPKGLSFTTALRLITTTAMEDDFLSMDDELSLYDLLKLSREMQAPISRVVSWLRELGVDVPDVAETIRSSLARVPRMA